ncbi:MAG: primosomal protein N' [Clostridia bacterium]|nr:primosomal protein N' [Clostridia bacterium]
MVAEVIINRSAKKLNRTFDYNIPKEMQDFVIIGSKVLVPFGKSKELEEGYVIGIKENSNYEIKDIAKIEDNLTDFQIKLAKWMARHYFCNVSDCIKLMLTPGTGRKENKVQDKTINVVYLKKEIEEIEFEIETKKIKSEKQIRILKFVKDNEGCTIPELETFTDTSRAIINTLIKNEYLELVEKIIERNPLENKKIELTKNLKLTEEQQQAYDKVEEKINNNEFKEFLLYGVTGSGKTEIYLQLIKKVLEVGKTAIVLVPEISLTPQMLDRFISRFGKEEIAVLHSKLSIGERHDEWKKIKEGKIKIVIGARSAIFAPLENLGLVIIDEEHDSSYKSETTPKYNAKEIAEVIGKVNKCPVVLGSATPDLNTYYRATMEPNQDDNNTGKKETIELLKLTKRANESSLPEVEVVDLKQELANGNRSMLSVDLYSAIEENLKNKLQTILFLNRRGYSTFIMCRECGYTVKCPNCNISLTYHRFGNILKCHYCGHEEKVVTTCPECGSSKIRYFGTGTQKLEQEINKLFPNASTIRMDVDTVTKKNSHEEILNKFKNENIDILIGTQMVVKGHHFPNVTLVGVITADSSLNIDDYRANERTFQILTQVAGRAGRENKKGKVIIQSYTPENFSIECSKKQDYEMFYKTEIALRKQLKYPPFCDILLISFNSTNEKEIQNLSANMFNYLKQELNEEEFKIFKPMPCPVDKIQNRFRWRIIVKGNVDEKTNAILNKALRIVYNQNLKNTRVSIDVNPNSMM